MIKKFSDLKKIIDKDTRRWAHQRKIWLFLSQPNWRLVYRHRLCSFLKEKKLLLPMYMIVRFLYNRDCRKCSCDIPSHTIIGGGFVIPHTWGVVINSNTVIGENCTILSGVVIGKNETGVPTIGNNVFIGAGALLIGNIKIGNNAVIGAGAIVTHDVPDDATVVCESAKVIKIRSKKNFDD